MLKIDRKSETETKTTQQVRNIELTGNPPLTVDVEDEDPHATCSRAPWPRATAGRDLFAVKNSPPADWPMQPVIQLFCNLVALALSPTFVRSPRPGLGPPFGRLLI